MGQLRMSALASLIVQSRSRVTHTAARLERRGWVKRSPAPDDGRGVLLRLTDDGREAITGFAEVHVTTVRRHLVDILTPEQFARAGRGDAGHPRRLRRRPDHPRRVLSGLLTRTLDDLAAGPTPPPRGSATGWEDGAVTHPTTDATHPDRRPGIRRPPRAGPGGDPRRGQLPGAGLPRRRRHPPVHGERPRPLPHRRRRHRVRRPGLQLGADDPGPRPPGRARGGARGRGSRLLVRHPLRERGAARRGDRRPRRPGRAGAPGLQRHRGDDERHPAGPRVHRPQPGREVRRALPRPRRQPPGQRRVRGRHPRPARLGRRAQGDGRRDPRHPLQRRRGARGRLRGPRAARSPA